MIDSDYIFRRTLLGYYAEGMHTNFKRKFGTFILEHVSEIMADVIY